MKQESSAGYSASPGDNQKEPPKKINGKAVNHLIRTLQKEYFLVGKSRVKSWHAWLLIGIAAGIAAGIILVANRSGELESSRAASVPLANGVAVRNVVSVKVNETPGANGKVFATAPAGSTGVIRCDLAGSQCPLTIDRTAWWFVDWGAPSLPSGWSPANRRAVRLIVPTREQENPPLSSATICDYAAPPAGCKYVPGPNYDPQSQCGLELSCGERQFEPSNPTPPPSPQTANAQFISQTVPSTMTAGQTYPVSVTMKNTGTNAWNSIGLETNSYRLGSQNPQDNITWGGRILLNNVVPAGSQTTFNFTVRAPSIPGTYNFQWRMVQENVQWFGDFTQNVRVVTGTATQPGGIWGQVWQDTNGNGGDGPEIGEQNIRDPGITCQGRPSDVPIAVSIQISGPGIPLVNSPLVLKPNLCWQTNPFVPYFDSGLTLSPGQYKVAVTPPAGWILTTPNNVTLPVPAKDHIGLWVGLKFRNQPPSSGKFKILVDVNQLNPDEASQAMRFAADGVWAITQNSPPGIDWGRTLALLNAGTWAVSEDNPTETREVDFMSASIRRLVDGAMFYNEFVPINILSDAEIAAYASHSVSGSGPIGSRIIVLTRSYADGSPQRAALNHALENPNVSGAAFEFNPGYWNNFSLNLDNGCKYVISVHKKCYLLMPPLTVDGGTSDFLSDVQWATSYFEHSGGILNNPDVYLVLATYVRPNAQHYVSSSPGDRNSIETVVQWLKDYRNGLVFPPPWPETTRTPPRGWLDSTASCNDIAGWAQDEDTPTIPTQVHFYVDGPAGSGALAGATAANSYRNDLCAAIGSCNHGFHWSVPAQFRDGRQHMVYAYGLDTTDTNNNAQLSGSPKTFTCASQSASPQSQTKNS